jgi:D-threonate/D-erythronate kinase
LTPDRQSRKWEQQAAPRRIRSVVEAAIFADDATGSLEAGALLAACGIATVVTLPGPVPVLARECTVSVVDTETRHAAPGAARATVAGIAAQAADRSVRWIYKKTDSTLRGPIGAELSALAAQFPDIPLVYVPAYPAVGRTVSGGVLYVNGVPLDRTEFRNDPRSTLASASIPDLLHAQTAAPVTLVSSARALAEQLRSGVHSILVCDGTTGGDLDEIRDVLAAHDRPLLCAGPAGFIPLWAQVAGMPHRAPVALPKIRDLILVCGSMHPVSRLQARKALEAGVPVLLTSEARSADPAGVAQDLARRAWKYIRDNTPSAVAVFGGDTVLALCQAMEVHELIPFGEVVSGVAVCCDAHGRAPLLLTKAGGYGTPDLLQTIRERMAT